jgi:urease accessory protein UreE
VPLLKSLPVADAVYRENTLPPDGKHFSRDTVTLGWEHRLKTRARRRTDAGTDFATSLPRGTVLRQDDLLCLPTIRLVVRIVEELEPVLVVRPETPQLWALYAYQIGNSHQPLMLTGGELICPDILGMEQVLAYNGIPFVRAECPFTPVGQLPNHGHIPS